VGINWKLPHGLGLGKDKSELVWEALDLAPIDIRHGGLVAGKVELIMAMPPLIVKEGQFVWDFSILHAVSRFATCVYRFCCICMVKCYNDLYVYDT
jgi:hypothetical protein